MIRSTNKYEGSADWRGDGWEAHKYTVELRWDRRQMRTVFYTGMGWDHEPSAADVLESLLSDASSIQYDGVDQWTEEYGFEINSLADAGSTRRCITKSSGRQSA